MLSAISVRVDVGKCCIRLAAKRLNLSSRSMVVAETSYHNSAPYSAVGMLTFVTSEANVRGLTSPSDFSIDSTLKREECAFRNRL